MATTEEAKARGRAQAALRIRLIRFLESPAAADLTYEAIAAAVGCSVTMAHKYGRRAKGDRYQANPEADGGGPVAAEVRLRVANIHLARHSPPPCQCHNREAGIRPGLERSRIYKSPRLFARRSPELEH